MTCPQKLFSFIGEGVQKQARGSPEKSPQTVARVTATERAVLAYALVFLLVFFYELLLKTVYLIGFRDMSHCPLYIYTHTKGPHKVTPNWGAQTQLRGLLKIIGVCNFVWRGVNAGEGSQKTTCIKR